MNGELKAMVAARKKRKRWLAPLAGLLALAGVSTWSQEGSSFDEDTAHVAQALELESGITVADFGAGQDNYTTFLADALGSAGAAGPGRLH